LGETHNTDEAAQRNAVRQAISAGSQQPAAGHVSVADELAELARLRDTGVISPQEFETQKVRLLR
jgi:hypothetical protein